MYPLENHYAASSMIMMLFSSVMYTNDVMFAGNGINQKLSNKGRHQRRAI